jgi:prepilin-type processing-associated H-X9-DG protein/prepilin-type N-terminal cleavage/methylation domain-containing protein
VQDVVPPSGPRPHRSRLAGRAAFTLVELLVVVGIIALLIAILMPALSGARRQAQTIRCAANLSDIGRAMQQYAIDFKGRIPRGYDYNDSYRAGRILWAEALSRYVNHPVEVRDLSPARDVVMAKEFALIPVYQCPVFPNDRQPLDYVCNSWTAGGVNDDAAIVVTRLKRSSEIVFLTEAHARSDTMLFCYHDVWSPDFLPVDANGRTRAGGPPWGPRILNDNRHGGRINMLFLDGHVATKMFKEVRRADFDFLWVGPR